MAPGPAEYTTDVAEKATAYLTAVEDCLVLLPQALAVYDDARTFTDTTAELGQQESVCDEHRRRLCGAVGRARPEFSALYLRGAELTELFTMVDAVPDAAETFVRDFDAMSPALAEATARRMQDMAALVCQASELLTRAIETYVRALVTDDSVPPVAGAVERITELESQCDQYRNEIVARAFEQQSTADALVVRELVQSLDAVPDAVEDAADQLVFCWSDM
jgi:uncharacterized protein Yka (UPF0111/DUF47 family)